MHHLVDAAQRRADWTRNALRFGWELLKRSTREMLTSPKKGATWGILADEMGLSRRTIANLVSWFQEAGLLARAVPGSTVRFRPGTMCGLYDDGRGNEAAQYVLTIPAGIVEPVDADGTVDVDEVPWPCPTVPDRPNLASVPAGQTLVDETCTPNPSRTSVGEETPRSARTREYRTSSTAPADIWPATITPRTKADRLAACERLARDLPVLARISARHLRSVLRPTFDLGATVADIRHALDRRPDGTTWIHTDPPRWIPSWVRHRLSAWISEEGLVAAWPSQVAAAADAERRERQRRRRQERALANLRRVGGPLPAPAPLPPEEHEPAAPLPERPSAPNAVFLQARARLEARCAAERGARLAYLEEWRKRRS